MAESPAKRPCLESDPDKVDYLMETNLEEDIFSFVWTINNYSVVSVLKKLESPIFVGGPKTRHSWQLLIHPKSKPDRTLDEEYLGVYLKLVTFRSVADDDDINRTKRMVTADFTINILDSEGGLSLQSQAFNNYEGDGNGPDSTPVTFSTDDPSNIGTGWDKLMLSSDVQTLVFGNKLKIHCKIWIYGEPKHSVKDVSSMNGPPSVEDMVRKQKERLSMDFGKMFKESVMTDLDISAGTTTFKAHKAVLAARSPVFGAMFSGNMIKLEMTSLEISDFDEEVVKGMLEYIYTEDTKLIAERAPELLQIAENYDLKGLKEACEIVLAGSLSNENVGSILVLAYKHNAEDLKQKTVAFINKNREKLLKSKSFQDVVKTCVDREMLVDLYFS